MLKHYAVTFPLGKGGTRLVRVTDEGHPFNRHHIPFKDSPTNPNLKIFSND